MIKKLAFILFAWLMFALSFILRKCFQLLRPKNNGKEIKKILIFPQFFPGNAGYHYRVSLWKEILIKDGFHVESKALFNEKAFLKLTSNNNYLDFHFRAYTKRFLQIWSALKYDCVIVRRALLPYNDYGNLFLDKLLLTLNNNVILDFDDDLTGIMETEKSNSLFGALLFENRLTFYKSLQLYKRFTPGSQYLKALILKTNKVIDENEILVLPTCVNYHQLTPRDYKKTNELLTIGWIGSNNNQSYLLDLIKTLNNVNKTCPLKLLVISGKDFVSENAAFEVINKAWSIETEVSSLQSIDIGIMPLPDNKRTRGKCAFKLIQYMGLGIVSVADDVGANKEVVLNEENGFLVHETSSWEKVLFDLSKRSDDFHKIGENAQKRIRDNYSFDAHKVEFKAFLTSLN